MLGQHWPAYIVGACHPNIWNFLGVLHSEQSLNQAIIAKILAGRVAPPQRKWSHLWFIAGYCSRYQNVDYILYILFMHDIVDYYVIFCSWYINKINLLKQNTFYFSFTCTQRSLYILFPISQIYIFYGGIYPSGYLAPEVFSVLFCCQVVIVRGMFPMGGICPDRKNMNVMSRCYPLTSMVLISPLNKNIGYF